MNGISHFETWAPYLAQLRQEREARWAAATGPAIADQSKREPFQSVRPSGPLQWLAQPLQHPAA